MPKLKLSKTNIDEKAKPSPTGDVLYFDTVTRGFGLRVTPKGVTTFIAQGRVKGTKTDIRVTIGTYGAWTVDDARRRAEELRHQFEDGIDPREVRKQAEIERNKEEAIQITLQDIFDAYSKRHGKLKPSSEAWTRYYVEKVFVDWKDKPLVSITGEMVKARHNKLVEGGLKGLHPNLQSKDKRKTKGAPATANAAMVVLRILIKFANRQFRIDDKPLVINNPTDVMADYWADEGTRTDRYIDKRKVGEVWNALHAERLKPMADDSLAGIDLAIVLMLTGARRMEIAALTWDRVNIDKDDPSQCWFHLPDPKSGREVYLPLNSQAVVILESRKRVKGNPHVFPTRSKAGHIGDPRAPFELISEVAGMHLSAHDLRRTFTNIALRDLVIEKFRTDLLTCHKPSKSDTTVRHYVDTTKLDWLHPEVQRIGDWIEGAGKVAAAKASGANVVSLPSRA